MAELPQWVGTGATPIVGRVAVLPSGLITVALPSITANSFVFLTPEAAAIYPFVQIIPGVGFKIGDPGGGAGTVAYMVIL